MLTEPPVLPLEGGGAATLTGGGGGGGGEALTGFDSGALNPRLDPIDIPMMSSNLAKLLALTIRVIG